MAAQGTTRALGRACLWLVLGALVPAPATAAVVGSAHPALRSVEQVAGRAVAREAARAGAHAARLAGRVDVAYALALQCRSLAGATRAVRSELDCVRIGAAVAQAAGRYGHAMRLQQRRQYLASAIGDGRDALAALNAQAALSRRQSRYHEAIELSRLALLRADAAGEELEAASALSTLSLIHKNRGDYPEALEYETAALARREKLGSAGRLGVSLLNLAALHEQLEDFPRALDYQARALAAAAHSADPQDLPVARVAMAGLLNDSGTAHAATARALAELGWEAQRRAGNRPAALDAQFHVGRATYNLGDNALARAHLTAVLAERVALGQLGPQAHAWFRLSEVEAADGRIAAAIDAATRAAAIYRDVANPHRLAKTYGLLERYHELAGDTLASLRFARERLLLRERLLGAGAMQKINARLVEYRAARDAARIDLLQRGNQVQALTLERNAIQRRFNLLIGVSLAAALVALLVRYRAVQRANRLLEARNLAIDEQRRRLAVVNSRLWVTATTDPLTGLVNRAQAFEQLGQLLAESAQRRETLVVALLDIDHFKRINDGHGHLAGDAALRQVATTLRDTLALASVVARLGGEEFLVVLGHGVEQDADAHLEAARRAIAALVLPGLGQITVSIGWVRSSAGERVDELIGAADAALYRAKARGRNAVERAPPAARLASSA